MHFASNCNVYTALSSQIQTFLMVYIYTAKILTGLHVFFFFFFFLARQIHVGALAMHITILQNYIGPYFRPSIFASREELSVVLELYIIGVSKIHVPLRGVDNK